MNLDRVCQIVDCQLIESQNRPLNSTEITILKGIWQYQTYAQIAIEAGYSPGYFTTVVAPELYQRLAKIIGQRVTKKNCRRLLESYVCQETISPVKAAKQTTTEPKIDWSILPCYPSGSVPLNSPFYLKRSCESRIDREIEKPGALIRIKAPREMGKTSLLLRNLDYAKQLGYQTVSLNLEQVENSILNNLNLFLRWLCANISRLLPRQPKLEEYWDEDLGSTPLGEGSKIKNQLLIIDTNVIESNPHTNRTAVTYFLAGGEPDLKKFKFPGIVANDNESVFYRAKITLV